MRASLAAAATEAVAVASASPASSPARAHKANHASKQSALWWSWQEDSEAKDQGRHSEARSHIRECAQAQWPTKLLARSKLTTLKDQAGLRGHSADAILLHFKASGDKKVTAKKYRAYVMERIRAHPAEWA